MVRNTHHIGFVKRTFTEAICIYLSFFFIEYNLIVSITLACQINKGSLIATDQTALMVKASYCHQMGSIFCLFLMTSF